MWATYLAEQLWIECTPIYPKSNLDQRVEL